MADQIASGVLKIILALGKNNACLSKWIEAIVLSMANTGPITR
jgi:hypothetical protein